MCYIPELYIHTYSCVYISENIEVGSLPAKTHLSYCVCHHVCVCVVVIISMCCAALKLRKGTKVEQVKR